jgi:hypothetical protein
MTKAVEVITSLQRRRRWVACGEGADRCCGAGAGRDRFRGCAGGGDSREPIVSLAAGVVPAGASTCIFTGGSIARAGSGTGFAGDGWRD